MAFHANDKDPANCPICNAELHSINTKRIGNKAVCRDCAYKLLELWNAIGDKIVDWCILNRDLHPVEKLAELFSIEWEIVI